MTTALVIHGHFYQPPRENPWTELVEREPGAAPFRDWNERIHAECYRPNAFSRISDALGRELGLEANLECGQEILYEAAAKGAPLSKEAREFAPAHGVFEESGPEVFVNS